MTPEERAQTVHDELCGFVEEHEIWITKIAEAITAAVEEEREACAEIAHRHGNTLIAATIVARAHEDNG